MNVWNYSIIVNWGEIRAWSPRRTNYPKFEHQYLIINVKHVIYFLQLTKILFTQQNIYYLSCPLNFDETKNYGITTGETQLITYMRKESGISQWSTEKSKILTTIFQKERTNFLNKSTLTSSLGSSPFLFAQLLLTYAFLSAWWG